MHVFYLYKAKEVRLLLNDPICIKYKNSESIRLDTWLVLVQLEMGLFDEDLGFP